MQAAPLQFLRPFARILFTLLLIVTTFILIGIMAMVIAIPLFEVPLVEMMKILSQLEDPGALPLLQYFQIVQEVSLFLIPALIAAFLFAAKPWDFLRLNLLPRWQLWLLTIIILATSIPVVHQLIAWNEAMQLPGWLGGVEAWMQQTEQQAAQLTELFLGTSTLGGYLFNMVMIAILPALGEELLFRGLLQRLLADWFHNVHVAVLVTAFLFGAMHMQFYGLLPRMVLGILFGYLLVWSRSLWIPILAHFLNNGIAVTISFLEKKGSIAPTEETFNHLDTVFFVVGSFVICLLSLYIFWYMTRPRSVLTHLPAKEPVDPEQHG